MNNTFSLTGVVIDLNLQLSRGGNKYLVVHIQAYQARSEDHSWVQTPFELLAYGELAEHAQKELSKGMIVVLQGRMSSSERIVQSRNDPDQTVTYFSTGLIINDYCILGKAKMPSYETTNTTGSAPLNQNRSFQVEQTDSHVEKTMSSSLSNTKEPAVPNVSKEEIKNKIEQGIVSGDSNTKAIKTIKPGIAEESKINDDSETESQDSQNSMANISGTEGSLDGESGKAFDWDDFFN